MVVEKPPVLWITPEWLDEFASDALALEREMYEFGDRGLTSIVKNEGRGFRR